MNDFRAVAERIRPRLSRTHVVHFLGRLLADRDGVRRAERKPLPGAEPEEPRLPEAHVGAAASTSQSARTMFRIILSDCMGSLVQGQQIGVPATRRPVQWYFSVDAVRPSLFERGRGV